MKNNVFTSHVFLFLLSVLLCSVTIPYFPMRNIMKITLVCYSFLCLCALFLKRKYFGFFIYPWLLVVVVNSVVSLISLNVYNSDFNAGFAMSILVTNEREAIEMIKQGWLYMPILILSFIFVVFFVRVASVRTTYISLIVPSCAGLIFIFCSGVVYYASSKYENNFYPKITLLIDKTPFFNLSYFIQAGRDLDYISSISDKIPHYNMEINKNNQIDTIVLVVGESARRDNLSIYGYKRKTSPYMNAQMKNMLIFEQAYSPAPITVLSVPMILSSQTPNNYHLDRLSDNVINVANAAGYDTYWLSTQTRLGEHNTAITAISNKAKHQVWLPRHKKDGELIPYFIDAVKKRDKKKLIVVHINGSHPNFCSRYESSFEFFSGGMAMQDCYDNSILYTDYVVGELIENLSHERSAIVYTSDHGLVKAKDTDEFYVHGANDFNVDGYKVPMLVWFSNYVNHRETGFDTKPYSIANNYELVLDLMGVNVGQNLCASPLRHCQRENFYVMNANGDILSVEKLK